MELIIILIAIIAIVIVQIFMKVNVKELKDISLNEELNNIAKKCPENKIICKEILEKLENKTTKIVENKNSEATLYMINGDKILIGNTYESYTRIQTMAHECLHSIQDKKMLFFNFVYSNFYLLFFVIMSFLTIIKKLPNEMLFGNIFLIFSFVYYVVRIFLENDAMIKSEYLAKQYLEDTKILSKEEIEKICKGFKIINDKCVKGTNCTMFIKIMIKVVVFNILALIF